MTHMSEIVLYVRSKEVSFGTSPGFSSVYGQVTVHSGSLRTTRSYGPDDQEAINLLEENKIAYTLVDLTGSSFAVRLKAKLGGVKTPTMTWNEKKIVGTEDIKQALKEVKNPKS